MRARRPSRGEPFEGKVSTTLSIKEADIAKASTNSKLGVSSEKPIGRCPLKCTLKVYRQFTRSQDRRLSLLYHAV